MAAWFTPASSALAIGAEPFGIAVGDFNHDGVPDFAVTSSTTNTVGILLGKGGGTFKPQVTYAVGSGAYAVAVGDFNGDGNLDLAVTNFSADTVSILLGNGDGTFQAQQTFATGNGPDAIAVGDFNGDGNLDLAVTNQTDNTISILSGNGNGTFQGQQIYATGSSPVAIAVGNFNGDGYLDLAVVNNASATVSILLGNGDGTFQTQVPYATGNGPISIAVSDFNSDGSLDLAVANSADNTLSVLMGNGDGTFQTQVAYSTGGTSPEAVAAANLSGLGYIDLAVTNLQSSSSGNPAVIILQNNGSGTFTQASHQYVTGAGPLAVAAGDWNGDGMADLAVLNNTAATVTVLTNGSGPVSTTGATASIDLPGEHTVAATYSGDTNFSTSTSLRTVSAATVPATLTFTANPNPSNYGSPVTLTATLSPYSAADVSSNGESIQFLNGTTLLGTGTLSSGVATLVTTSLPVGVNSIQAKYAGDIALTSTSGMVSQIVRPATLTVTAANTSRAFGAPNPSLTGTVSGALNGDTFTVTGSTTATTTSPAGSYPIVPTASGTNIADYTVVTVNGTLTVTKATPAITWAAPASITYGTALGSAQLNAASTIAGTFTYSPALGTVLSVGSHTLTATFTPQDTTDYTTATATVTLTVGKTTPTIALAASSTDAFAGSPITFAATLTSPAAIPAGTVSFYDGMALLSTATLNSGAATYMTSSLAAGTHSITAVYSGNTNFSAVTSTAVTETIETLAVTVASGGSSSVTASPGGQAVYTFTLAPPSGATFPAAIDL